MSGHSLSLDHQYITQSKNWIAELPVGGVAEKDSVLFMWAVSPLLPEALEVMKAWGFKYITVAFVWSKHTKNKKKVSNLGRWTMGNVEVCLLGRKGKPQRICKNIKQLVEAERFRHSAKPAEVRDRIVALMGDLPRLELFAREKTEGWDVWGNEVESDIQITVA
jgi:site-specific DNA-methyltransferase (adenine-specific)